MSHQAKRPYGGARSSQQSSITSYFPQTSCVPENERNYSLPPHQIPENTTSGIPSLPHSVQSNLLNVGMRVRKSVPEGYKTGSYSAFQLFSDTQTPIMSSSAPSTPSTTPKTRPRAGNRELTPFCGILKVGGMAGQQWGIYNPAGAEMDEDQSEEEVPFFSSQGSTLSNFSVGDGEVVTPGGNKRRFFEDEDRPDVVSTGGNAGFGGFGERVLAVPRRRKWPATGKVPVNGGQVRIFGEENFSGRARSGQDVDFEDAEFLDYGLGREVEMSG